MIFQDVDFRPPQYLTTHGRADQIEHNFDIRHRNARSNRKLLGAPLNNVGGNSVENVGGKVVVREGTGHPVGKVLKHPHVGPRQILSGHALDIFPADGLNAIQIQIHPPPVAQSLLASHFVGKRFDRLQALVVLLRDQSLGASQFFFAHAESLDTFDLLKRRHLSVQGCGSFQP